MEHVQRGSGGWPRRSAQTQMGTDLQGNHRPGLLVPGGVWQGARIMDCAKPRGWTLMGCTLRPAWDEQEFELGRYTDLAREFPGAAAWIRALTR